jgi:AraC-like DNA-binding protein
MLFEPGETHSSEPAATPQDFKALFVSVDRLENLGLSMGLPSRPHFTLARVKNGQLFRAFVHLHAAIEAGETALEQQSRLACCLQLLLEHCVERKPSSRDRGEPEAVERAKSYLYERFAETVTLSELSTAAGLSEFHLVRTFTKRLGLPPHAYQIALRVARARELLSMGIAPVTVASELGFADQSHFTRHFKRTAGVTPRQYALGSGQGPRRKAG